MDKVHRQHGSIVLYEEKKDGEQYIRIAMLIIRSLPRCYLKNLG